MVKRILLGAAVFGLCTSVTAEDRPEAGRCHSEIMTAASDMLRVSGAVQVRGTMSTGRFAGVFLGVGCAGLTFESRNAELTKAGPLKWTDLKTLEVGRRRSAGWKGALVGVAAGAALGALIRSENDDALRSGVMGALVFGVSGATWPVTKWRPVVLPKEALAE